MSQPSTKKRKKDFDLNLSFPFLSLSLSLLKPPKQKLQVADWEPKIRKIVSWFDQLQAVDLEAEEEKERELSKAKNNSENEKEFSLRADEINSRFGDPSEALSEAPEREGNLVKVPKIM